MDPTPRNTFIERVVALPRVEYGTGYWREWETDVPTLVRDTDTSYITVFVVPQTQYLRLQGDSDHLMELRRKHISLRTEKASSKGGQSSTFRKEQENHPIDIGRPHDSHYYPIPISLLHPEFALFQDAIRNAPLDPLMSPFAWKFATELSELFEQEEEREEKFHELMSELLELPISKCLFRGYQTDGTIRHPDISPPLPSMPANFKVKNETTEGMTDGAFENILDYQEGVRHVVDSDDFSMATKRTRLPSALVLHNGEYGQIIVDLVSDTSIGPNIQVSGAVCLTKSYVEVISSSVPLHFNRFNPHALEDLIRLLSALRQLYESLVEIYLHPENHAIKTHQADFPYYNTYDDRILNKKVSFRYLDRVSRIRLVFQAQTEDGRDVFVKFGYGHYGMDAHLEAAQCGIAPALLGYQKLAGLWMVVMDPMPSTFMASDEFEIIPEVCAQAIRKTVREFHSLGFVHGDLRDTNIFVRKENDKWDCMLIDFDWSGKPVETKYPAGVYTSTEVWRTRSHMDGQGITTVDDWSTVEHFLSTRQEGRRL